MTSLTTNGVLLLLFCAVIYAGIGINDVADAIREHTKAIERERKKLTEEEVRANVLHRKLSVRGRQRGVQTDKSPAADTMP